MSLKTKIRLDDPRILGTFQRMLEIKETEVIQSLYPDYKAAQGTIVPIDIRNAPWAESSTYAREDGVVQDFELFEDYGTNMPTVDRFLEEKTQRTFKFINGYIFNEDEVARSIHLGQPIEDTKIRLVRQAYMQTLNKFILYGNRRVGMPGFLNHPSFLRSVAPYSLIGSTTNQILTVLEAGREAIRTATLNTINPDTLLLPPNLARYLNLQARLSDLVEKSVLRYWLEGNGTVRNIETLDELEGAGPAGEDIIVFYKRAPEVLKARITDPFRFRDMIQRPFSYARPVAFKYNGIFALQPNAVHIMYVS